GGALVFGTCTPLLADAFDSKDPDSSAKRTRSVAAMMGIGGAASAFGPLVGGALVETGTWEWIFAINIPIGIFVMRATLLVIPDLHREERDARRAAGAAAASSGASGTSVTSGVPRISVWAVILIVVSLVLGRAINNVISWWETRNLPAPTVAGKSKLRRRAVKRAASAQEAPAENPVSEA
ncbi:MAG: MFS transporter, partial [Micrococcaceae bacterium]|nr:MFS transporter [Micrococcaceae bacterium]